MAKFSIRINKGEEQILETKNNDHFLAAGAALALLEYLPADKSNDIVEVRLENEHTSQFYCYDKTVVFPIRSLHK